MENIDDIIDSFDEGDYDLITALIPFFVDASWQEYTKYHQILGYSTKDPDFQFILSERIWDFLDKEKNIDFDLELVSDMVEKKYGSYLPTDTTFD